MTQYRGEVQRGESTGTYIHLHAISSPPTPLVSILNSFSTQRFSQLALKGLDIKIKVPLCSETPRAQEEQGVSPMAFGELLLPCPLAWDFLMAAQRCGATHRHYAPRQAGAGAFLASPPAELPVEAPGLSASFPVISGKIPVLSSVSRKLKVSCC